MTPRDHGGGLDAAIAQFGGTRSDWLDLSTGINPVPYPLPNFPAEAWNALPDTAAQEALEQAARRFWRVPETAAVLAAPGASCLIAQIPRLGEPGKVRIDAPTYNEHAAAFTTQGWRLSASANTRVVVHPNNPTGALWQPETATGLTIIDESFCDVTPDHSLIARAGNDHTIVLKSFGKFWGLAGLRLGFAIGSPDLIDRLRTWLGPWPVSGPALAAGAAALKDTTWAVTTRGRLTDDAARLDHLMRTAGAAIEGGTALFRLYKVEDAAGWQERLARHHVWSRIFPYSQTWLRLGLPAPDRWDQLKAAL